MFDCVGQRDLVGCLHEQCKTRCIVNYPLTSQTAELSLRAESVASYCAEVVEGERTQEDLV